MPRPEKVQAVAEIKERLEGANAVFATEYAGLSVKEQQELRRNLRASDSEFKVVKMTLARRAADELGLEGFSDMLVGPTGLTFADADAAATAKVLNEFAKVHERLIVKGGVLAGEVLPPERVSALAELEPREVLLARIAGAFEAPMAQMAGLLAALPRGLATALGQLVDKRGGVEALADEPVAEAAETEITETDEPAAAEGEGDAPAPEAEAETTEADEATTTDEAEEA